MVFNLAELLNILSFQVEREITNLAILSLEELEKERDKRLKLEAILKNAGFEDEEFFGAAQDYLIARKRIFDNFKTRSRQMVELINKFNIKEVK